MKIFTAIMTKVESNTLFIWILTDCSVGEIIKIRLSEEEKIESEKYEDFSEFIETLEDKYGFNLGYCSWMSYEVLSEPRY